MRGTTTDRLLAARAECSQRNLLTVWLPLCSVPQSTPPFSFSLSPLFFLFIVPTTILSYSFTSYTQFQTCKRFKKKGKTKKKPLLTRTQNLRTYCTHGVQRWSASNVPKQMAETNFSLFADSCATSCNKKSMNQAQSIYSNNKEREICHFPTPCFRIFLMKTCLSSLPGVEQRLLHMHTATLSGKRKKKKETF